VRGGHLHKFEKLLFGPFHSTSTRRYISRRTTALEEKKDEVKKKKKKKKKKKRNWTQRDRTLLGGLTWQGN